MSSLIQFDWIDIFFTSNSDTHSLDRDDWHKGTRVLCAEGFSCDNFVQGGIHLTNGAFLPTSILKEVTATEEGYHSGAINWNFVFSATKEMWDVEQERLYNLSYTPLYSRKIGEKNIS